MLNNTTTNYSKRKKLLQENIFHFDVEIIRKQNKLSLSLSIYLSIYLSTLHTYKTEILSLKSLCISRLCQLKRLTWLDKQPIMK